MALGEGALLAKETSQSMALNIAIFTLALCGETHQAQREADAVLADARSRGAAMAFAEASLVRAFVLYERGKVAEAMVDAQNAVDGIDRGWHAMGPIAHGILAQCHLERGELEAARGVLERAHEVLFGDDAKVSNAWFHLARGRYRLTVGQPEAALEDLLTAGSTLGTFGHQPAHGSRALAGLAAHSAGQPKRAALLIDEALSLSEKYALPVRIGQALRARSVLEPKHIAMETLRAAVTVLEETDSELELAKTLIALGRLQRHLGKHTESRSPLRQAMDLAHRCGALASEKQARDELMASGARPRGPATHGIAALTPTERRVADLACSGHTNRRIAETLFRSKNTIDWHLRRVYRKLDVDSRDQLRRTLTDRRP
jgi:ATP/maltotriose-dependent transcriptional regulator MalT